jgi:GTP-binding protein
MRKVELLATVGRAGDRYPAPLLPEIAFAGRSNVGKSSLINALLQRKNIARVSKKPGKTATINIFRVDQRFHLADLPGYGFARTSGNERARWARLVADYFRSRSNLAGIIHLVDGRHPPQPADHRMRALFADLELPFLVLATKIDKVKRSQRRKALQTIVRDLSLPSPDSLLPVSVVSKEGIVDVWRQLQELITSWQEEPTETLLEALDLEVEG